MVIYRKGKCQVDIDSTKRQIPSQSLDDAASAMLGGEVVKILVHEVPSNDLDGPSIELVIVDDEGWWEFPAARARKKEHVAWVCAIVSATASCISMIAAVIAVVIQILILLHIL